MISFLRACLDRAKVSSEGKLYLDKRFISHVPMTVPPVMLVIALLVFYESDKGHFADMIIWSGIMISLQLLRYFFAVRSLSNWHLAQYRIHFFIIDCIGIFWWLAYLYLMGSEISSEAQFLWRAFIVYLIMTYYLSVMRYSLFSVTTYPIILTSGTLIYLIGYTNIDAHTQLSLIILNLVGVGAMLQFGLASYLMACDEYKVVAENAALISKLNEKATHDPLTHLHNRNFFSKELMRWIKLYERYQNVFSVVIFDIDFFKNINDTYGHLVGDKVLRELSELVTLNLRQTDVFARFGGEEFVLILPEELEQNAVIILEKLRQKVAQHRFCSDDLSLQITISIGATQIAPGDDADLILNRADVALYRAKQSGRNRVEII